ncbi:MAG TPA: HYR domain-containing protein [Thermoanaerobaculia bacterium]|nr:HYR domain-containing protein [Thermoanaerobaculia bacterium]
MRTTLAALILLLAANAGAGTIDVLNPAHFTAFSGEEFITAYGSDLGNVLVFDGPAGHFEVQASGWEPTRVTGWVPEAVIKTPGSYTLSVRGWDGASNVAPFEVFGDPDHPLVVLGQDPIVVPATSPRGAVVEYTVHAYGGQGGATVRCDPPSGSLFPLGGSHVACRATNPYGETASGGVYVFVYDAEVPVLTLPNRIVVDAEDETGAVVEYTATAGDSVDGDLTVTCSPASGSRFPVGVTTVSCTAVDSSYNYASGAFEVEVRHERGTLVIHVPDDISVEAEGPAGVAVAFEVTASGSADPNPQISCDPVSGSTFPLGTTTVLCSATDRFGARAEGQFGVTVTDTRAPSLALPDDQRVRATSSAGAVVTYEATASDVVDGDVAVQCEPASGSQFPVGTTTVQCTASDTRGNTATGSFRVEVYEENTPVFVIHVPDHITVEATGADGATVTFSVTTSGSSDPDPSVSCDPASGSTFPIGTTTVQCIATDSFGATAQGEFNVTVGDTTAPHVGSISADLKVLSPANHKLVGVTITVDASDAVDPMPQCTIVNVIANEPILGPGSGNTDYDWQITGALTVDLRAERSGEGSDRVYTVFVSCVDASDNETVGTTTVTVPKGGNGNGDPATVTTPKRRAVGRR